MIEMRQRHPKTTEILEALKAWCAAEYGRKSEVARYLEVSPGLVGDWLAGRRTPSIDQGFFIRDFLNKQRKRK